MRPKVQQQELLNAAIAAVNNAVDIKIKVIPLKGKNQEIDAEIAIEGYKKARYAVAIKKWAPNTNFGALLNRIKQLPGKGILVADYVNPKMADRLKEKNIPYIDTFGNAYIDEKPLYIFIKTEKGRAKEVGKTQAAMQTQTQGRAFNPTGLKVVYLFLTDEIMLNAPYREIARRADVALGTIGWVINDLKQGGFLVEVGPKNRRLRRKQRLLEKWVDAYLEKLRPKLAIGTFSAENPLWWKKIETEITNYGAKWGGEVAAHRMTKYLHPEETIVYLETGDGARLFQDNRLRKDPYGRIHVYQAFWENDEPNDRNYPGVVNPLITYADLVGTGDTRNLEIAEILLGEELAQFIGED